MPIVTVITYYVVIYYGLLVRIQQVNVTAILVNDN